MQSVYSTPPVDWVTKINVSFCHVFVFCFSGTDLQQIKSHWLTDNFFFLRKNTKMVYRLGWNCKSHKSGPQKKKKQNESENTILLSLLMISFWNHPQETAHEIQLFKQALNIAIWIVDEIRCWLVHYLILSSYNSLLTLPVIFFKLLGNPNLTWQLSFSASNSFSWLELPVFNPLLLLNKCSLTYKKKCPTFPTSTTQYERL